jgi:sugar O-acyltransferase (sialic acid O-acetyltransferase NeuD family)
VIELLRTLDRYDIVGLLDAEGSSSGRRVAGVPIVGTDEDLPKLRRDGIDAAFVGVGSIGDARLRYRLFALGRSAGFEMISAVHPTAFVSPSARIGSGAVVMALAALNAGADVGDNVIVNTSAVVEHGCALGAHSHVATGARLAGDVMVGDGSHIGIGAIVVQGLRIGRNTIVGAGAVVLEDVGVDVVVGGVPARQLRRKEYAWPI